MGAKISEEAMSTYGGGLDPHADVRGVRKLRVASHSWFDKIGMVLTSDATDWMASGFQSIISTLKCKT